MKTWISIPNQSDFTIYNIPFGIYSTAKTKPRVCIAIGDQILDLVKANNLGSLKELKIKKNSIMLNKNNATKEN